MIKFKKITIQNFMSIGNIPQIIDLSQQGLTLVLGENTDTGISNSRNGAGKTTIINAISYALYGQALTNIKRDNLINKSNNKNMLVTLEFEINSKQYIIERGRKPNSIVWKVNNGVVNAPDTDEAEGDSKWTQKEIEKSIQLSHMLFKHLVALNTFTEPFLALRAADQRAVIEELFGITLLSQKADKLRELLKQTKDNIREEELLIKAKNESNVSIQKSIDNIKLKSSVFERDKIKKIKELEDQINQLSYVNIDDEISAHKIINTALEVNNKIIQSEKEVTKLEKHILQYKNQLTNINNDLEKTNNASCPLCEQALPNHKHENIKSTLFDQKEQIESELSSLQTEFNNLSNDLKTLNSELDSLGTIPDTFYSNLEEVYNHKNIILLASQQLDELNKKDNPYDDQINTLEKTGLQEISYDEINRLTELKEHQEFLLKLLTDKGSFIRKKIIDQNLSLLNHRLSYYLEKLGLPHNVVFLNDLSVEITQLGNDYDFDNLSRGERNRLILSLSWAFRDVYESMNTPINLLFIDEIVDSGTDSGGVEAALGILKDMTRTRNKVIYLISHREELVSRCENTLVVKKENGFTTIEYDMDEP